MSDDKKKLQGLVDKADASSVGDSLVKTFMSKSPVTVPEGTKIYSAIQMLSAHQVGAAPVVNAKQQVVGVISEHDLLLQTATKDVTAPIQYTSEPVTVTLDTTLKDALLLLYKRKVRRMPVVENQQVVGIVTRMDILSKLIGRGKGRT